MADSIAVESGKEAGGSQTQDAGNPTLARGAAGLETGARPQAADAGPGNREERRENEQVTRPSADGVGEGMATDRS